MAREPILTAYFINPSYQSVLLCLSLIVARQRLGKNVTAATNTHAKIEELLDASFSIRFLSYQNFLSIYCYLYCNNRLKG
jgi:hypothetical protein